MARGRSVQDGGVYKHNLARVEVESLVAPLRDKEPTPAWRREFDAVLKHFNMSATVLARLASESNKTNLLGRHYTTLTLNRALQNYQDKNCGWTANAQKTVNDHLDIIVDYLSKPDDAPVDPYRSVTSYGIKDIYPSPNQIAQEVKDGVAKERLEAQEEEEPKTLLQRLEESGRKPVHPKTKPINTDEPQPGESWADYGNRLAQRVEDAKRIIAESGAKLCENFVTLVSKKPVKVKLTKVHIIRR